MRILGKKIILSEASAPVIPQGDIEINNLTYSHPDLDGLFRNMSLKIRSGESVGLVGKSGSGKSTLVDLLMGEYKNYCGTISIGGVEIRTTSIKELRKCIALVPQKVTLFRRTIKENIEYPATGVDIADIQSTAECVRAATFINKLRDKYDTNLNKMGKELSGGEQQRIILCRALLRLRVHNTNILIVDEGTSALDNETEQDIENALFAATKGKIAIVIAHRLSTLKRMSKIIVFDKGSIVEEGTHDELLSRDGSVYRSLWNAQIV